MEKRTNMKAGNKPVNRKQNGCKATQSRSLPHVSKVSKATWAKTAKQVLQENIGAWKILAKE